MHQSEQIAELAAALSAAQAELRHVAKDKTANIPTKTGGSYSYKYADLASVWDVVREPLTKHGLSIIQIPDYRDGWLDLETVLMHKSGQFISGHIRTRAPENDVRGLGSAITYLRRYALSSMIGLVADEDDDGAASAEQKSGGSKPATTSNNQPQRQPERQQQSNGAARKPPQQAREAASVAEVETIFWQDCGAYAGLTWPEVQAFLGNDKLPKPTTIEGWRELYKLVRSTHHTQQREAA